MKSRRHRLFWWTYFALLIVWFLPVSVVEIDSIYHWAEVVFSWGAIAALWAQLRQRRLFSRQFWVVYTLIYVAEMIRNCVKVSSDAPEFQQVFIAATVIAFVLQAPLLLALWRYVYRSPSLWQDQTSPNSSLKRTNQSLRD